MWYVIWTTTGEEKEMEERVKNLLPEELYSKCWVPVKIERQKWDGVLKDVERILFPGYLFIDTDKPEMTHTALKKIPGFTLVLKTGDDFTPISDEEEKIIRKLTGEDGKVDLSVGVIENGELHIIDGPLKGWEKYVVKVDRHRRKAYLEIEMLGKLNRFSVGLEIVGKS